MSSGGSVLAYLTSDSTSIDAKTIIAAVRSKEQAIALTEAGFNAQQVSLDDEDSITKLILQNESTSPSIHRSPIL